MSDSTHDQARAAQTMELSARIGRFLLELHADEDIPIEQVVAAAHSEAVVLMATVIGGEAAHKRCVEAGAKVRPLLSLHDIALASATPAGRA